MTEYRRTSGILLPITALPSVYGIGDFGPGASRFLDFLARARQGVWQVLPLNPTDPAHANSPYSSSSSFAGNPLLISPDRMVEDGFLGAEELQPIPAAPDDRADYEQATAYKTRLLDRAWQAFRDRPHQEEFREFCREEAGWLEDYALFVVIKRAQQGADWSRWPVGLRDRNPRALDEVRKVHADELGREQFAQWLFFRQWLALKREANARGIRMFGDIPIYVNYDSADTWRDTHLFKLNGGKRPEVVAGVPPDYFSTIGQLWGNPVYDWEALKREGYRWWIDRLAHVFRLYDIVRIDHFRGLVAYWEVPAGHKTAQKGKWREVPTDDFLQTLQRHFGRLPVVAEDLGLITDDVTATMKRYGFPGMKVLLFAFGADDPTHPYLPRNYDENAVVYTGTHDNNTVQGWFEEEAKPAEKKRLFAHLSRAVPRDRVHWAMIELALQSRARLAVIPMQDVLGLPGSARMNTPSTRNGNWTWRLTAQQLAAAPAAQLAELVATSDREPEGQAVPGSTPA
ncbi:MAG TPA: 4-alpha-glucanotransferase [candidate division Zixibacteria bacterium]|nr:4-alpha-glucanotransferase [candidate division Zixibacteria bacterium]MDD4917683.1 4-alpha-glucanotransferase [candidate division Zixibacteria bacterium]MDM7974087.1 4-alpha-glucanotransferase [candidate division Zixibacteria bacterium]HOD65574.1 4-alpha-glucanotransferase [candidate division Zixibacteria bacterium]HPM36937.1 4-alpha-glucanotransferase [candidate division Zixibacteria bacterium]